MILKMHYYVGEIQLTRLLEVDDVSISGSVAEGNKTLSWKRGEDYSSYALGQGEYIHIYTDNGASVYWERITQ